MSTLFPNKKDLSNVSFGKCNTETGGWVCAWPKVCTWAATRLLALTVRSSGHAG